MHYDTPPGLQLRAIQHAMTLSITRMYMCARMSKTRRQAVSCHVNCVETACGTAAMDTCPSYDKHAHFQGSDAAQAHATMLSLCCTVCTLDALTPGLHGHATFAHSACVGIQASCAGASGSLLSADEAPSIPIHADQQ